MTANFNSRTLFSEQQRFTSLWIWIVMLLSSAICFWPLVQEVILGLPIEESPMPVWLALVMALIPFGLIALFRSMRLDTRIYDQGIEFRFAPLQRKMRKISWSDVKSAEVRNYKPIREYGGWGIRYGWRNGRAYNVTGNIGLQLVLQNGKRILIGTQKSEEMQATIRKLNEKGVLNAE